MEKLIFINSKGVSIEIGNQAPFVLKQIKGLDGIEVQVQTKKSPFQYGKSYLDTNIDERLISINLVLLNDSVEEKFKLRERLLRVFNPILGEGTLKYIYGEKEKEIKVAVDQAPKFNTDDIVGPDEQLETMIHLVAADPFLIDTFYESEQMKDWVEGFRFTFRLPMNFCKRGFKRNFENKGDVETPIIVNFLGQCVNPIIINRTTGEFIKVNRELQEGEKLIINTSFIDKSVEIEKLDGSRINAFGWIDLDSKFFNLSTGLNLIEYGADSGLEDTRVLIKWKNRYVGV